MKRTHAFLLAMLALGLLAMSIAGIFIVLPRIDGPSVPRYILTTIILAGAGVLALYHALRDD